MEDKWIREKNEVMIDKIGVIKVDLEEQTNRLLLNAEVGKFVSVNNYLVSRTGGGRAKTTEASNMAYTLRQLMGLLRLQVADNGKGIIMPQSQFDYSRLTKKKGYYFLHVNSTYKLFFDKKNYNRRDVTNYVKIPEDVIFKYFGLDDRWVKQCRLEKFICPEGQREHLICKIVFNFERNKSKII